MFIVRGEVLVKGNTDFLSSFSMGNSLIKKTREEIRVRAHQSLSNLSDQDICQSYDWGANEKDTNREYASLEMETEQMERQV